MNVIIIEDEIVSAKKLKDYCYQYDKDIEIVQILGSVKDAKSWLLNNQHPDLILLDVHLSDGICFSVFDDVDTYSPVIFTTAYDKYAIQAFQLNSIDYLLKPIKYTEFCNALAKLKKIKNDLYKGDFKDKINKIYENLTDHKILYKERFLVKTGKKLKYLPVSDIAYFYADNKLTFLMDNHHKKYPIDFSLDELEMQLNPHNFFRINRKFIVHISAIKEIYSYYKGRLKLELIPPFDDDIIISNEKTPDFKNWLDK